MRNRVVTGQIGRKHISKFGIRLLAGDRELFLPYKEFPWFKNATINTILNVKQPSPGHFYWPDLDVDLDLESIDQPKKFPLKSIV